MDLTIIDPDHWFLPQQSGFWTRTSMDSVGCFVREDLHYTMDRELYYRICAHGRITLLKETLATYRLHPECKSMSLILNMYREDPKALAYGAGQGVGSARKRRHIGRLWKARGHYRYAGTVGQRHRQLWHLLLAAANRPGYLLRGTFHAHLLDSLGLRAPVRWLWRDLFGFSRL
jgi:hypothetical protein